LEEARFGEEQPWARIKFLDSSQVLLNDGKGTPARLTKKGAVFAISAREITEKLRAVIGPDIWQQELEKDNIPPEEFLPEITRDPAIFEGKYFLTFSATDKQTGVDYYQVSEQKRIAFIVLGREEWKEAKSPYLLEDQGLRSIIKVKAVDEAGNERIEVIIPKVGWQDILPWVILVLIVGVVIWWIVRKCRKK
jgi:hypothetical protein